MGQYSAVLLAIGANLLAEAKWGVVIGGMPRIELLQSLFGHRIWVVMVSLG
jgi:hypothetical protein